MSYKTQINFGKLITWLIPLEVSRPKLLGLTLALCYNVQHIYSLLFKGWSKQLIEHINITPQVGSLEFYLNNRFDYPLKRIYIEDGVSYPQVYLYTRAEAKPVFASTRAENKPVYLGLRSEGGFKNVSFRVRIPRDIKGKKSQIEAFVQKYKLPGKSFEVIEI